jgi:SAM-dependent methyltransferase
MGTEINNRYVPALGHAWLTAAYDPVVRVTTRERAFKRRLLASAHLDDAHSLLDIGCGTGTFAIQAKRAHPEVEVVGLDADPRILETARAKAATEGIDVSFVEGVADRLPFPDRSFDRVTASLFFHHLATDMKLAVATEILRVLLGGGQLHVADWGIPANTLMRVLFVPVQLLDGFANTNDNLRGELPLALQKVGFEDVEATGELSTMLGTLAFYSSRRPEVDGPRLA